MNFKIPEGIKNLLIRSDKIIVVILALILAALSVLLVIRTAVREKEIDFDFGIEAFAQKEGDDEELKLQQELIEKLKNPEEMVSYQGLSVRDLFDRDGRVEGVAGKEAIYELTIEYRGNLEVGGRILAQINWQEGKVLRTFFAGSGDNVKDYEVLEIIPNETMKLKSPEGEEIEIGYKKAYRVEKTRTGN